MENNIILFLKKHTKEVLLILAVLIGVLLIAFSARTGEKGGSPSTEEGLDEYCARLEERVGSVCSSVKGVGRCRVIITLERGEQSSYKGSALLEVRPPKVLGVTVICEGADRDSVRLSLTEMLTALFDIGSNRIAILKLN